MKKKKWMKRFWIALPVLLVLLLLFTVREQRGKHCTGVNIVLENTGQGSFISENDILEVINTTIENPEGRKVLDIDITALEKRILKIPFVADADVYFTLHGVLKVRISQRNVIARVFNIHNQSAFIADDGTIMPVTAGFHNRVLVASGNIKDSLDKKTGKNISDLQSWSVIREVHKVASFIDSDTFYSSLIAQIYVNKEREIELIPSIDNHIILIGNSDSLEYKLSKLMAFYTRGMTRTGWEPYSMINLKYSNQVICTNKIKTQ